MNRLNFAMAPNHLPPPVLELFSFQHKHISLYKEAAGFLFLYFMRFSNQPAPSTNMVTKANEAKKTHVFRSFACEFHSE